MSSSSVASAASSQIIGGPYPLITQRTPDNKKQDWIKVGAMVAVVIGALISMLSIVCMIGILPYGFLGGTLANVITLAVGAVILIPAAYVFFRRWKNPPSSPAQSLASQRQEQSPSVT